jgi:N-acetylmuramoyl-L-alanine amidase
MKWILSASAAVLLLVLAGCGGEQYSRPAIVAWPNTPTLTYIPPKPAPHAPVVAATRPNVPADWIPPAKLEQKGRWQGIIVHHSATTKGNAAFIDRLHKDRGFEGLGYDFVIDNGTGGPDGLVEVGWRWKQQREGAHTRVTGDYSNYWNEHAIGICLIGNFEFQKPTDAQYKSLARLVSFLQKRYNIPTSKIKGHGDVDATRCPGRNFAMTKLKAQLK